MCAHRVFLTLLMVLHLAGCTPAPSDASRFRPVRLIEVPQTRQATNYTCGVAVAQSILAYNGHLFRQDVLEQRLGANPERGTTPESLLRVFEEHGIGAEVVRDMTLESLRATIDSGRPVICFLQAWNEDPAFDYSTGWDDGHYAIAIGYDAERVYFMDPSTLAKYAYIDNDAFLARWHDGDAHQQVYRGGIVVTNRAARYRKDEFAPML